MAKPEKRNVESIEDLFEGVIAFGEVGSGKTTCDPKLWNQLIEAAWSSGYVCVSVKDEDVEKVRKLFRDKEK